MNFRVRPSIVNESDRKVGFLAVGVKTRYVPLSSIARFNCFYRIFASFSRCWVVVSVLSRPYEASFSNGGTSWDPGIPSPFSITSDAAQG
jgi:hypothetical protein